MPQKAKRFDELRRTLHPGVFLLRRLCVKALVAEKWEQVHGGEGR